MTTKPLTALSHDPNQIGAALARVPSGCSVLTAGHEGRTTGLLVSWVQQAAFSPPLVSIAIREGRPALELLKASKKFILNVLGENPTVLLRHFARGFTLAENAFEGLATHSTDCGVCLDDCISHLACELRNEVRTGDHVLVIAEVVAAAAFVEGKPYVHLRKTGLSY